MDGCLAAPSNLCASHTWAAKAGLLWCRDRLVYDLGDLPPRSIVAPPEIEAGARLPWASAPVTRYDPLVVSGLYHGVEGVGGGHVVEMRSSRGVDRPRLSQHDDLAQLTPGDVVVGTEVCT